jgi:hypothetical protein
MLRLPRRMKQLLSITATGIGIIIVITTTRSWSSSIVTITKRGWKQIEPAHLLLRQT